MVRTGELYAVVENAVEPNMCDTFVNDFFKENEEYTATINGGEANTGIRKTSICWIENPVALVNVVLQTLMFRLNTNRKWFYDLVGLEPVQIAKYTEECFYKYHQDAVPGAEDVDGTTRKLSGVLMLSDPEDYEGGDLKLFLGQEVIVPRSKGSLIVFPSTTFHEVTPVTKGVRYTATVWARGPSFC